MTTTSKPDNKTPEFWTNYLSQVKEPYDYRETPKMLPTGCRQKLIGNIVRIGNGGVVPIGNGGVDLDAT